MDQNLKNNITNICDYHYNYLLNLENVTGIGLGYKHINKVNTFEPSIHVLVEKKVNQSNLTKNNIVPKTYMGIKTDVIAIGKNIITKKRHALPERIRPLKGGYGINPASVDFNNGSIGCIVKREIKGNISFFILSNNHVMAFANKLPLGTKIIQPCVSDGGSKKFDVVASLEEFIPIKFKNPIYSRTNYMDCAIARIYDISLVSNQIGLVGKVNGTAKPSLEEDVLKVGLTTGLSQGKIKTINVTLEVLFPNGKYALFKKQVTADLNNDAGDSGAVVLNKSNQILGLIFSATDSHVTFNKIDSILEALKIEVLT